MSTYFVKDNCYNCDKLIKKKFVMFNWKCFISIQYINENSFTKKEVDWNIGRYIQQFYINMNFL